MSVRVCLIAALAFVASSVAAAPTQAQSTRPERAETSRFVCPQRKDNHAQERPEVEAAIGDIERTQALALDALDHAEGSVRREDFDHRMDALRADYLSSRRKTLTPLALSGNVEAMSRLAVDLRDSSEQTEVASWFALTTCAASNGDPLAADELVRWYWHQGRDGSIREVQRNRAEALDWADTAARRGNMFAVMRVAVYIAGNVHQYPADLALARRLMELCARTDFELCEESLVQGPYNYGLSPSERGLWLATLASRQPLNYQAALDRDLAKLNPSERDAIRHEAAQWQSVQWTAVSEEWRSIREAILAHGAASIGADALCTTQTPWCRGALIAEH